MRQHLRSPDLLLVFPDSSGPRHSIKRNWQLKKAVDLFLEFRKPTTPIAIARQLGRLEENIELYTLESLPFNKVDMLTILVVGNSQSMVKNNKFLTPRGYLNH